MRRFTTLQLVQVTVACLLWMLAATVLVLAPVHSDVMLGLWGVFIALLAAVFMTWLIAEAAVGRVERVFHKEHLKDEDMCRLFAQAVQESRASKAADNLSRI